MSVPAWFDKDYYLQSKLDQLLTDEPDAGWTDLKLLEALNNAGFNPFTDEGVYAHFEAYGHAEAVSPNPYFDVDYYMNSKLDLLKAAEPDAGWDMDKLEQAFKDAGLSAWDHFTLYGLSEGIDPSQYFDTSAYMEAKLAEMQATDPGYTKEQLAQAFTDAGLNPIEHYLLYGKDENLSYTPYPTPVEDDKIKVLVNDQGKIVSVGGDTSVTTLPEGDYALIGTAAGLNAAAYNIVNGANGDITLQDNVTNLVSDGALTDAAKQALDLASKVAVTGSLGELISLPSEITGKSSVTYTVDEDPSTITLTGVSVAQATNASAAVATLLSNPYVSYAEGVTPPASADDVTISVSSVIDTVANFDAADLNSDLFKSVTTYTVEDTAANIDGMTGTQKAEFGSKTVEYVVDDTLANIFAMKTAGSLGTVSFDVTDSSVDATLTKDQLGVISGKTVDFTGVTEGSISLTLSADDSGAATLDASKFDAADGVTFTLTGNSNYASTLTGSNGVDAIIAGAKGDTIDGGLGADTITLGAGADKVTLGTGITNITDLAANIDTINSFSLGSDSLSFATEGLFADIDTTATFQATSGATISDANVGTDDMIIFVTGAADGFGDASGLTGLFSNNINSASSFVLVTATSEAGYVWYVDNSLDGASTVSETDIHLVAVLNGSGMEGLGSGNLA